MRIQETYSGTQRTCRTHPGNASSRLRRFAARVSDLPSGRPDPRGYDIGNEFVDPAMLAEAILCDEVEELLP